MDNEEADDFQWAVKSEGHLITRKAGASARERAEALAKEAPVRTRLARVLRVHTDERAWRLGGEAEEEVGRRLAKLDKADWLVLNDIPIGDQGANVDHVVIGPAGVFTLNTKHHPKAKIVVTERTFRVNGYRQDYLPKSVREAARATRLLQPHLTQPVAVRPVIIVMGAEMTVKAAPPDVFVIGRKELPRWFRNLPVTLTGAEVKEIARVAGRPSTWKPSNAGGLRFRSWNRYGKRRLYVNDQNGESIGYLDEISGELHVPAEREAEVRAALKGRKK